MKLLQLKKEIERLIAMTPYSKDEVFSLLNAEPDLTPDELFAYSVAIEYLNGKKSENHKKLLQQFTTKRDELIKNYS